ncbi:hypothetical protein BC936DRAFT_149523 [Jimgerdemannia flammicorona]|uniref:Uncharacterized protein n=1 Tax=Jimgerdemannia flammicorona TaxID=994334 RepID=A0A433DN68_9FUNG|nr:hypothetical protein BC936DRAFT_149523 [Jimgerdemannia flammicorona]
MAALNNVITFSCHVSLPRRPSSPARSLNCKNNQTNFAIATLTSNTATAHNVHSRFATRGCNLLAHGPGKSTFAAKGITRQQATSALMFGPTFVWISLLAILAWLRESLNATFKTAAKSNANIHRNITMMSRVRLITSFQAMPSTMTSHHLFWNNTGATAPSIQGTKKGSAPREIRMVRRSVSHDRRSGIEDRDDLVIGKQSDACLIPSSLPSYHPASYVLVDDDPKIDVKPREPVSNNDYPEDLQRALEASVGDRERHDIEKATAESLAHTQPTELTAAKSSYYDPNKWAVVTVNKNEDDVNLTRAIKASISLTWWTDPDDPKMRTRVPGLCAYLQYSTAHFRASPTALRPPTHGYQFTPPVLQALYHVPIFRRVVLGYRPSIERWGSPDGYWRGEGDSLPIIQPMPDTDEDDEQRPPYAGQAGEAVLLPTSMKSFYELQKLFAFMELTDRSYGNVMHVLRSLHLPQPAGWDDPEGSVEGWSSVS